MIEVSGVTKTFGTTTVLEVDHLVVGEGSNTAIVGPNGAGKSTLLLLLTGLSKPTTGSVMVGDSAAGSRPALRKVSFAPDQPALFDDLTLNDQMNYVARLNKADAPTQTCLDLLDALNAGDLLERFPRSMSKGQRQKSSLLVATARPFEVLLLDEPTTALDSASRQALLAVLSNLSSIGATVVSSSHNPDLISSADHQIRLENGQVNAG